MATAKKITLNSIITRSDGFVSADLDDETVLMSIEEGTYFGFDVILSTIWKYIEKPISVTDLISTLLKIYDVEKTECEKDVLDVLSDMFEDNLVLIQS